MAHLKSALSKQVQEIITCSICHDTLTKAVSLRCGHVFCEKCILQGQQHRMKKCSSCKASLETGVQSNQAQKRNLFPPAFAVRSLIELLFQGNAIVANAKQEDSVTPHHTQDTNNFMRVIAHQKKMLDVARHQLQEQEASTQQLQEELHKKLTLEEKLMKMFTQNPDDEYSVKQLLSIIPCHRAAMSKVLSKLVKQEKISAVTKPQKVKSYYKRYQLFNKNN
jgi:RING-type zinc-finger